MLFALSVPIHIAFFIVGVGSNLSEAGTTFSVEVMYHLEQGVGF